MTSVRDEIEQIPVTIVVAIAYVTLAFVTGMFGEFEEFARRLDEWGRLTAFQVAAGEPWRLVTYAFLHGGPAHLIFNMLTLIGLAPALERSLGSVRFALLYLLAALGGGLAVCVFRPEHAVVGGSGALFGMMGTAVAMNMRSGRHVLAFLEFEGPRRLLGLIALNLVLGHLLPMVSNTGHVGGLLAGFAVTLLWLDPPPASATRRRWRLAIGALFVSLTFASLVPVTRADWLLLRAAHATDPARAAALQRASERSADQATRAEPDDAPFRERGR